MVFLGLTPSSLALVPWLGVVLSVVASNANIASARALPNANVLENIHDAILPTPNTTEGPLGEIQCYALPYGAIGIISHLLTYWTIAWVAVGRSPLWPVHRIESYGIDMFLAAITLCTCIPIASLTIHRCRLSWHFVLIAVWKLVTSVSLACLTIHRCIITRQEIKRKKAGKAHTPIPMQDSGEAAHDPSMPSHRPATTSKDLGPLWWLLLYLAGTITGMVGLCSLIYISFRHDTAVRNLTYAFAAPMIIIPILVAIYWYVKHLQLPGGGFDVWMSANTHVIGGAAIAFTAVFGFFSALYSDLVLGAIAGNMLGLPSGDFAVLYWAWFIAKRFTLLSL
ncbi:hypothetical protein BU26DRAFT_455735 [Trematosphaeria pertusa]|uniref:Uncharacterized protein n=1 Tax=Trematosphaeria pertusa TaxID=390896 RepID=A0A6A6IJH2_9PLEO|nr:uncharacterized protein BU26DRAFT_455735 [Trematosphaeria pertusa]KAF2250208.1 hypothetical protein BU26DRAFT_455735 [Trematosphaeria pertusa]